jgi:ATP-dependent exoDNAse (exonuclease V) alpha subunit
MRTSAKKFPAEWVCGLKAAMHLAEGAQVMLTQNISATLGLVNGTTGAVQEFIFADVC